MINLIVPPALRRCLLIGLAPVVSAVAGGLEYPLRSDTPFKTERASLVEGQTSNDERRLPAAATSGAAIPNATLVQLERSGLQFSVKLDGPSTIGFPVRDANDFSEVSFWVRVEDARPGTLRLRLLDARGLAFQTDVAPVPVTWTRITKRLDEFDPVDESPAGRATNMTLPLSEIAVAFQPAKVLADASMRIHLGSFSFGNGDPQARKTYPYGPGARVFLVRDDDRFPDYSRFLPPDLEKTHYLAVVYEGGDDTPYKFFDKSDKFQLARKGGGQLVFRDKDRLCLVQQGKGEFDGRYRFGTIKTDKIKLGGGEILQVDYAALGLTAAQGANRLLLEFTDGSSVSITDEFPLVADGTRQLVRYRLPAETSGRSLASLRVNFGNSREDWAEVDIHAIALLHPHVNNRLDADKILAAPPRHDVRVEVAQGVPVISIDGRRLNGMGFADQHSANATDKDWDAMLNQIDCEDPIARLVIPLTEDIYLHASPAIWKGPDYFDYSYLDEQMRKLLSVSPGAKVMIYLQIDGSKWWNYRNPAAVGIDALRGVPDFLSDEWKTDLRDAIRQFIAYIQTQSYAETIIGYQIWGGGSLDTNVEINDGSPRALARFRDFLRKKYGTDTALQQAWGNRSVTLDAAMPDTLISDKHPYDRGHRMSLLVDPSRRHYLDTYEFRSHASQQNLINISEYIKEATHGRAITGARVGNFIGGQWIRLKKGFVDTNYEPGIDLLLQSPAFDLIELQEPYPGRSLGYDGGIGTPNAPQLGMALHGKLIMVQNDYPWGYNTEASMDERSKHTRRVYTHAIMTGLYPYEWRVAKHRYTFDHPKLLEEYRRIAPVFQKAVQKDRESVAEVAMVVDLDYKKYLGTDPVFISPPRAVALFDVARYTWPRAGMPFDMLFLDQIADARPYKVYVFFHTLELTPEKKRVVETLVREKGAVAIFIWADFLMNGDKMDTAAMSDLIGMTVRMASEDRHWSFRPAPWVYREMNPSSLYPLGDIERFQHQGWQPGRPRPSDNYYSPSFVVEDGDARPIAFYKGTDDVAIALKKVGRGTSIYNAGATISPSLLRYAGKLAGCFQYLDTEDTLLANKSFVSIHAGSSGDVNLALPAKTALYEVFTGREFLADTHFKIPVQKDETYLFFRGSRDEWEAIKTP